MGSNIAKLGSYAGWVGLAGIFGYHLSLTILAGQRVSGTTDVAAITAYYKQPVIAATTPEQFLVLVPMLVFGLALRETLATNQWSRFLATLGFGFMLAELPVIMAQTALEATLVTVATNGGDVLGLFRFWDVLYNSGAYVLEAAWILSLGLASRDVEGFPRWVPRFSYLAAALQLVAMSAIWLGIPDAATLPGNLLLGIWMGAMSVGLGRLASRRSSARVPVPA